MKSTWQISAAGFAAALAAAGPSHGIDRSAAASRAGASAPAGSYPSRPIRMIVPSAPGGGLDFMGRLIGGKIAESVGQSVIVDNRSGGTGTIAGELTAQAAPDGYTLLLLSASQVVFAVMNKTRFDLFRDFAPVSHVAASPYVLVVNPQLPVKSVKELIAYAKANPSKLNYASSGTASLGHMAAELFSMSTGTELVHVPYKSIGAATPDLFSGQVQMSFGGAFTYAAHIRSQRLRPLAIAAPTRFKAMPELPTMIESGVPGYVVTQWYGLVVPRATPRPVVERLHREVVNLLRQADVVKRLSADGTEPLGSSPQELASYMKTEYDTWVKVAKHTGIIGK